MAGDVRQLDDLAGSEPLQARETIGREVDLRDRGAHLGRGTGIRTEPEHASLRVPEVGAAPIAPERLDRQTVHALEHVGLIEMSGERFADVEEHLGDLRLLAVEGASAEGFIAVAIEEEGAPDGRGGRGRQRQQRMDHQAGLGQVGDRHGEGRERHAGDDELADPAPGEQDHEAHQQAHLCHGEGLGRVPDPGVVPAHQRSEQRHETGADRPLPEAKPRRPAGGHREETRRHLGPVHERDDPHPFGIREHLGERRDAHEEEEERRREIETAAENAGRVGPVGRPEGPFLGRGLSAAGRATPEL